jgi:hypothetical protein
MALINAAFKIMDLLPAAVYKYLGAQGDFTAEGEGSTEGLGGAMGTGAFAAKKKEKDKPSGDKGRNQK